MATKKPAWLSREAIAEIVEGVSAADLIEASADTEISNAQRAGIAFNRAAERQGISNGKPATESIRASDFMYLAEQMASIMEASSPKSEPGADSPDSAATGA